MSAEAPAQAQRNKGVIPAVYVVLGVVVILLLAALLIWGIVGLAQNFAPEIEAVRDVFIIALALESCLFGVVLLLMLIMIIRLVNTVEFEIKPILDQTQETIGTVRGTTRFVSENVIRPVVTASSYVAGLRRGFRALFGDPARNLPD